MIYGALPSFHEQTAIVRFLDHADLCIERYIRSKQKLLQLLEEQKQAIIHQAVTGQIDVRTGKPYPSYKSSGVGWLEDIPSHWEVKRLKYLSHLNMGQSPSSADCSTDPIGLPFLQGCAEFGTVSPTPVQYCRSPAKICACGAILVSVRAPVGRFNFADQIYGIGRGLCAVEPFEGFFDRYFAYYSLGALKFGLSVNSTGSTYDAVSVGDVSNLQMPVPIMLEQSVVLHP